MINIFRKFLKPYIGKITAVVVLTLLSTTTTLMLPMISRRITDQGAISGDRNLIMSSTGFMILLAVLNIVITVVTGYMASEVSMGFAKDLRLDLFKHVAGLSQGDINKIGSTSLISRQTNDVMQLQTMLTQLLQMFLIAPFMVVVGIVMAWITAPDMIWMFLFMLPLAVLAMIFILVRARPITLQMQKKLDDVNRVIRENLNGMRVIRAFNRETFEEEHFGTINGEYRNLAERSHKVMNCLIPVMTLITNAINLLIIYFGSRYMDAGNVSFGDVQAFIQYVSMVLMALSLCSMLMVFLPRAQIAAERINEIFNTRSSVKEKEVPEVIPYGTESSIAFNDVSFMYGDAEKPVLSHISFEAKKGQTLAIIGGTGSGKSTVLNLINREYDVCSGSILLNGTDIKDITLGELHRRISVVPQKAFLFSGSIVDNIRFGREDATDQEVNRALETAQAKDFVEGKEGGIYARIAQGGSNVSGGQRQRLAIARALIKKPDVYLFDDSFSALDFKTDAKLRKLLKEEVKDAVMIIVAQRVSTIQDADRILVLDAGRVVGDGKHEELIETCAIYREIALSQIAESEDTAV